MNIKMIGAAVVAAAVMLLAPSMASATRQNFTLVNETGYTIKSVYVSPTSTTDWQEDVLGQDELEDDHQVDITFPHHAGGCIWDLKVVYLNDVSAYWTKFDLCTISTITIHYNAHTRTTSATWE